METEVQTSAPALIAPNESKANGRTERQSIQSVDRALTLLETIAQMGGEATLTSLSVRTKLNISTCHHLLATLVKWGFVAKVPGRRTYALGSRIQHLSQACMRDVDLPNRAQPYLDRINAAIGETVYLCVLHGDQMMTIQRREARHAVRVDGGVIGRLIAPHATALGKAMLAWLPDDEVRRICESRGMKRFTPNTITELPALFEALRQVRLDGFAVDREEFEPGIVCIGAAIRGHAGIVVGSLSASIPTVRATEAHLAEIQAAVTSAARALSAEMSDQGSRPPFEHAINGNA